MSPEPPQYLWNYVKRSKPKRGFLAYSEKTQALSSWLETCVLLFQKFAQCSFLLEHVWHLIAPSMSEVCEDSFIIWKIQHPVSSSGFTSDFFAAILASGIELHDMESRPWLTRHNPHHQDRTCHWMSETLLDQHPQNHAVIFWTFHTTKMYVKRMSKEHTARIFWLKNPFRFPEGCANSDGTNAGMWVPSRAILQFLKNRWNLGLLRISYGVHSGGIRIYFDESEQIAAVTR